MGYIKEYVPRLVAMERYLPSKDQVPHLVSLFIACIIGTQISISLLESPAVVPIAAAVGLVGLVLGGITLWPAILLACLIGLALNGVPPLAILVLSIGNTLLAILGTYILQRFGFDPQLSRMRDTFLLVGVSIFATLALPVLGFGIAYLNTTFFGGMWPPVTFWAWWVGLMSSFFVLTPIGMTWFSQTRLPSYTKNQLMEIAAIMVPFIIVCTVFWWRDHDGYISLYLFYAILLGFIWMALRFDAKATTFGVFVFAVSGILGTIYGIHEYNPTLGDEIFGIQILNTTLAFIVFVIMSIGEERRTALNKLREQVDKLELALQKISAQDQAKSNFIAVLAHELRNPLAPIVTSLELLKLRGPARPEDEAVYSLMEGRVTTIRRLLDDLLDVSRISRDKLVLQREYVDLCDIAIRSVQSMKSQFNNKEQSLSVTLPDEPLIIHADPVRIEQCISNLLSNASKFTEPHGRVSLTVSRVVEMAEVTITDSGAGIKQEMLERIFEPFLQAELGRRGGEGLGIGLSLVKRLADLHDGSVRAKSGGPGHGSEFTICLPLAKPEKAAKKMATSDKPQTLPNNYRVLVVDDNKAAAETVASLLELKAGFVTARAYTGAEAHDKYRDFRPDAIVLDIGLPDTDGYEVAKALRSEHGFVGPIIALTGYSQEEDKRKAFAAGFDHHFTKPVGIDEIIAVCGK